ncbi:hypothetical protein AB0C34_26205 [Nocardia sp. NPDC049220]|uniref:hypothetical protein n=1 Tax=Nocardia sp. NPDC049220 TaxID=3155273 RepID=UPI00340F9A8E
MLILFDRDHSRLSELELPVSIIAAGGQSGTALVVPSTARLLKSGQTGTQIVLPRRKRVADAPTRRGRRLISRAARRSAAAARMRRRRRSLILYGEIRQQPA